MEKLNFLNKSNGDILNASDWNAVTGKVDAIIDAINSGEGGSGGGNTVIEGDSHVVYNENGKHNLTIQTLPGVNGDQYLKNGELKGGKINIESASDLLIKPGDDITLYSHHRAVDNQREVTVKVMNGSELSVDSTTELGDYPVDLLVNTANITLTTKDKATYISEVNKVRTSEGKDNTNDAANILNIEVNKAKGLKGYLKVRAQAIDLRCEEHGGIALLPKGEDGQGHMNKIKFEHGGGDGLEFGTFNAEKTSIFTDEYRFNKDGIWKMASRVKESSDKIDQNDPTTSYKYKKNTSENNLALTTSTGKTYEVADDFYDFIDIEDVLTTTEAIIKSSAAFNGGLIKTAQSSKGNLKITSSNTYKFVSVEGNPTGSTKIFSGIDIAKSYTKDYLKGVIGTDGVTKLSDYIETENSFTIGETQILYKIVRDSAPKISLESEEEVDLSSKYGDVVINAGETIKQEAPEIRLNAIKEDKTGGMVNFGATLDVLFISKKLTLGLKVEASVNPTKIKQVLQNNCSETVYWDNSKFILPLKKLYLDNTQTTELNSSNYQGGLEVYFDDGTKVPMDYSCYVGYTTEDNGTYTTDIYAVGTKGSSAVLKNNLFLKKVATYTSSLASSLGSTRVIYDGSNGAEYEEVKGITYIGFEVSSFDGTGLTSVLPEEFVVINEIELNDIFTLINFFKTGDGQANGPWAPQL